MHRIFMVFLVLIVTACSPEVKVHAPDKPIEINMNINIDHRVRVEMEKDLDKAISNNSGIF